METDGLLPIGKIVGAHGIMGALRVFSFAESPSVFKPGGLIYLKSDKGGERTCTIKWAKPHRKGVLLALKGIDSRNGAESLIGAELLVNKESLPKLEKGTYYWFDIVGLSVFTFDNAYIGRVTSILPTGSNDVYVVQDEDKEILVPALESVVVEIDFEKKRMTVDLPEGL